MKILITGANGLLGQKITALLLKEKACFAATGKTSSESIIKMDISSPAETCEVIGKERPDVIIHAAALTQVDDCEIRRELCFAANVKGVENIVSAAEKANAHLIHLSTDFVFDGKFGPLDENAIPNPVNYYGKCKLEGEEIIRRAALSWSILRTVLVYGAAPIMSRPNIVLWVKKSLEEKKAIKVVNDQWRTPTLAEDLAAGCLLAARKKAQGIYHISGKEMFTPFEIAVRTADFFNLDKSLLAETDSSQFAQPAKRPMKTGFIIAKAERELGFKPHSFEEGLRLVAKQLDSFASKTS